MAFSSELSVANAAQLGLAAGFRQEPIALELFNCKMKWGRGRVTAQKKPFVSFHDIFQWPIIQKFDID